MNQSIKGAKPRVEVIAEIANAHQGDPETALQLAGAAAGAGADAVKFQIYFAHELLTESHERYEHFRNQAFSPDAWRSLIAEAKALDCAVYADVFGIDALDLALELGVDGLKVHSCDLTNRPLLDRLSTLPNPLYLATGGSTVLEIKYALDRAMAVGSVDRRIVLMHGFQSYPTKIDDARLSRLGQLHRLFGDRAKIGYADHTDGDDGFATILPLMAQVYGLVSIEKHVTFDRSARGIDYYASVEPEQLATFIKQVHLAQEAIGDDQPLAFSLAERKYRQTVKKHWVATGPLPVGHQLHQNDLSMKRANSQSDPPLLDQIVGHRLCHAVDRESVVTRWDVSHKVLAIIVARSNSSRLPGKATIDVAGRPAIAHLFERLMLASEHQFVDTIAFCTTTEPNDDELVEIAGRFPLKVYRGPVEDVLARMMLAVTDNPDHDVCLRITGDDILIDPDYLHRTVQHHLRCNAQYTDSKQLPSGTEVEVFDAAVLRLVHELSRNASGTEYLTNYIHCNVDQFVIASVPVDERHRVKYRLTLDTQDDYKVIQGLLEHMTSIGKPIDYTLDDINDYFDNHPHATEVNRTLQQHPTPILVDTHINWRTYTSAPLVTVYLTNHNYECYVRQSIESVLNQKLRDFELIIIDDGSTDGSRTIIERYRHHPKVTVVYQENKGLTVTNNIAINMAKGKYVVRLDADDYLDENALLVMTNRLERQAELALVFPDYYLVNEQGDITGQHRRHDFSNVTLMDQPAHGACTMIRRDNLLEVGGYSEEFDCQDGYDLWLKITDRFKVDNVNLPLFYYRQHAKSLTANDERILMTRHKIVQKHASSLGVDAYHHACVIPVRAQRDGIPLALRPFAQTTLLDLTLQAVLLADCYKTVVVTSCDQRVLNYTAARYANRISTSSRPDHLEVPNSPIEDTLDHLLASGFLAQADSLSVVNYEYPYRKSEYFRKAINTLYLFNADSIIAVKQENANFYTHDATGLVSFTTNTDLHLERSTVYREVGGIHAARMSAYRKYHKINGGVTTHLVLDRISSRVIESETDFHVYQTAYPTPQEGV